MLDSLKGLWALRLYKAGMKKRNRIGRIDFFISLVYENVNSNIFSKYM